MPVFSYEDSIVPNRAVAPLSSSSMTLFPLGTKKKKFQPRSISADAKAAKKPTMRAQEGVNVSVPQGVLTSLSQSSTVTCGSRLTLRPSLMHPAYQKWRLKEAASSRELSQGDGKAGLKDAIQKMNRLTLNASTSGGQKLDLASRTQAAKERKNAIKSHIVDISNLFHSRSKLQTAFVNKSNAKKQQDLKNEIRKYFEENGLAMSFLTSVKGMTPIKFYQPSLPTIIEETDEELSRNT